jgi:antitoxin ParD1/3/4
LKVVHSKLATEALRHGRTEGLSNPFHFDIGSRVNVKLTKQQRDYIQAKLKTGQYSNASEVVREAMRTQAALEARREGLEQAIEEGIESGPAELADTAWWKALDAELENTHGRRRRRAA